MAACAETYDYDWDGQTVELGHFSEPELNAFSLLIQCRRSLPIYLGDGWRCQACGCERDDLVDMANHILDNHRPEPLNEEDLLELQPRRCA